jgi:hypothetical protein
MSASGLLAKGSPILVVAAIILALSPTSRAADVLFFVVAKDEGFDQFSAAPPTPKGNPYRFNAFVGLTAPNSVTSATVQSLPGGQVDGHQCSA